MDQVQIARAMGALALMTCVVALGFGFFMQRRRWGYRFRRRLQATFFVVLTQTVLTLVVPLVSNDIHFFAWIAAASVALGVGMPVTFSLTVDLIPARDRGTIAAIITAVAYFAAAAVPSAWRIDDFRTPLLWLMLPAVPALAYLAFARLPLVTTLAGQHRHPAFARGRFVRVTRAGHTWVSRRFIGLIVLMFGIYFIDSLGFLRIIATPFYVDNAWRSPEMLPHMVIAGAHVVAALIAGVLYASLNEKHLFLWIFGLFALVHFMYTFPFRLATAGGEPLATPMLYAVAVSLYTVLNFALWADISTPETISRNAAVGVALSGWTATFFSTALATQWRVDGMSVAQHLRWVDAVAWIFFIALLILPFLPSLHGRTLDLDKGNAP
jgi:hypothetical protein